MTNEETNGEGMPELSYNYNLLGYAEVAGQFLGKKGGEDYARKSLETILKRTETNQPWLIDAIKKPAVLAGIVESQKKTYEAYRDGHTVRDILGFYERDLTKYLGDHVGVASEELEPFMDMKYGDILKEIGNAKNIINEHEYGRSTAQQVKDAKEALDRYQKVVDTVDMVREPDLAKFALEITTEMAGKRLQDMYPLPKPEEAGEE